MAQKTLSEQLDFLVAQRGQDEATLLALALRMGVETLYRETLVESYLLGKLSRERARAELGPADLEEIEHQRDALRRDVARGAGRPEELRGFLKGMSISGVREKKDRL